MIARRKRQRGMTLIELIMAVTMLVVGLVAILGLVTTAISSNNRNKMDTGGTMLAQMVLEKIAAQPSNLGASFQLQDCRPDAPNTWTVRTATANPPGNGSLLDGNGEIDWSIGYAAVPTDYKMEYVTCGANGQQASYDVRWNIQRVNAYSNLITVGARPLGMRTPTGTMLRFFAPPVSLRTIISTF